VILTSCNAYSHFSGRTYRSRILCRVRDKRARLSSVRARAVGLPPRVAGRALGYANQFVLGDSQSPYKSSRLRVARPTVLLQRQLLERRGQLQQERLLGSAWKQHCLFPAYLRFRSKEFGSHVPSHRSAGPAHERLDRG
jgi:hypothetical protein